MSSFGDGTINKAVIIAAGQGRRLISVTLDSPKEMLLVGGKPVLEYVVEEMARIGIANVLIVISRKKEAIREYFKDGSHWGINCEYAYQVEPWGTGDALLCSAEWVGEDSFVTAWGDTLFLSPSSQAGRYSALSRSIEVFFRQNAKGALVVDFSRSNGPARFQYLLTPLINNVPIGSQSTFRVHGLERVSLEENPRSRIPIAISRFVFQPIIFSHLKSLRGQKSEGDIHLTDGITSLLFSGASVWAAPLPNNSGQYLDIGTPRSYLAAKKAFHGQVKEDAKIT